MNSSFISAAQRQLLLLACLCGLLFSACSDKVQTLRFATGANGGTDKYVGTEVADILRTTAQIDVQLQSGEEFHGVPNCLRLLHRESDIAIVQNDVSPTDIGIESISSLRTIVPLYAKVLFVLHRKGIHASSLQELVRGRQVSFGPRTSSGSQFARKVLAEFGIDSSEYTAHFNPHDRNTLSDSADVCFAVLGFNNPAVTDMLNTKEGELFSLDSYQLASDKGSAVDGFCLNYPRARPYVIPKNTYGSLPQQPVVTLAIDAVLLARSDADPYSIYEVTKSILEHRQNLVNRNTLFIGLSDNFDKSALNFPLHPGALMYLERNEPSFLQKNSDVIGILLSVLLALAGGITTMIKWLQQKKKDRIDAYYKQVLEIAEGIKNLSSVEECTLGISELENLKTTAFRQLIAEKLAADESFSIFIHLADETVQKLHQHREEGRTSST